MKIKKFLGLLLAVMLMVPGMITPVTAMAKGNAVTVADWKLDSDYIKSGSLATNDLVIRDASGNGNDLRLNTERMGYGHNASDYMSFVTDSIQGNGSTQCLRMSPGAKKVGAFLETIKGAPVNFEEFEEGYTIEIIMKLDDSVMAWSSILGQKGTGKLGGMVGGEVEANGGLNISPSKELQWNVWTTNNGTLKDNPTTWSDAGGLQSNKWHHIVIKNDGEHTVMVVDGVKVLRCNMYQDQVGIASLGANGGKEGCWVVGTAYWGDADSFSEATCGDAIFKGCIQEIRMSRGTVDPKNYLVTKNVPDVSNDIAGNNDPYRPLAKGNNYTFTIIPDPQYTTQYKPEIATAETEWIRDNEKRLNIAMTLCVGDITQSGTEMEYQNIDKSFKVLDRSGTPYIVIDGNHDSDAGAKRALYLKYFGPDRYKNMPEYQGSAPSGLSSYALVRAGSYEYLILTLPWNYADVENDRAWVENVLKTHPENPTIIMSHFNQDMSFVKPYDQVFMTIRGHVTYRAATTFKNDAGHDVIDVIVNYQFDPYGGNGWLRTMEFDEEAGLISFQSYSPWVEKKMKILDGKIKNHGVLLPDEMHLFPFDKLNITAHPSDTAVFELNFPERFANMKVYPNEPPKTGDSTNLGLMAMLCILSLCGAGAIIFSYKKSHVK